jgi:peptidylprolyl isomerase
LAPKKGDFILLDYTATIKETSSVFDTTIEETARSHGIYKSGVVYEPLLVVLGEHWVVPGLDKALTESEVGEKKTVEIPPAEGFGERDQNRIKIISERDFIKRNIRPEVGQTVEINGQNAIVRLISGGRVTLDFNHPYSGKTLIYEYEIKKILSEPKEKVLELIHWQVPNLSRDKFKVDVDGNVVKIELPEDLIYAESLQTLKIRLAREVIKYIDAADTVIYTERFTFIKKPEEQVLKEAAQTTPQASQEPKA